jgi:hypothetical protein
MKMRFLAVATSIATGVIITTGFAQSPEQTRPRYLPEYTESGDLILPKGFEEWVYTSDLR